jgi:hypothetical protein
VKTAETRPTLETETDGVSDEDEEEEEVFGESAIAQEQAMTSRSRSSCGQEPDTPALGCELRHNVTPVSGLAQHSTGSR